MVEFALGMIVFLPLLIFFYGLYEVHKAKNALETCAYVSAQAAATLQWPFTPSDVERLKIICQHGSRDESAPFIHPDLSLVTLTIQEDSIMLLTASGTEVAYPLVSITASIPFVSALFPVETLEKYLPISTLSARYVRSFYVVSPP